MTPWEADMSKKGKKHKKLRTFYVTRDPDWDPDGYVVARRKRDNFLDSGSEWFCRELFEKLTGLKLKPGQQAKVRLQVL
jgi:hypothetical protein